MNNFDCPTTALFVPFQKYEEAKIACLEQGEEFNEKEYCEWIDETFPTDSEWGAV